MPVFLCVVRVALCAVCDHQFDIKAGGELPRQCPNCASEDWEWGPESVSTRYIRQGITKSGRVLNRGAKSRKRQQQGRKGFGPKKKV